MQRLHGRRPQIAAVAVGAALLCTGIAAAKPGGPGSLDKNFGQNGHVSTRFGGPMANATDVAVDSRGRTVAVGWTVSVGGHESIAVARYTPSGKLDRSFSGDGKTTLDVVDPVPGYTFDTASANAVAIDSKNRVDVCGTAAIDTPLDADFVVARFKANGQLDSSFGDSGVQTTGFSSSSDNCTALAIEHDGRLVAGGTTDYGSTVAVARYTAAGQLDSGFDGDGKQTTPYPAPGGYSRVALGIDSKQRIVVAGTESNGANSSSSIIVRYQANGSLDHALAGTGYKEVKLANSAKVVGSAIGALQIDSSGRYLVTGYVDHTGAPEGRTVVARIKPSGKLDHSFAGDGSVVLNDGKSGSSGEDVALDHGDVIVVSASYPEFRLYRFTARGKRDSKFNSHAARFAAGAKSSAGGLAVGPARKYVVGGQLSRPNSAKIALARFLGAGR